jgi:hypothetical protein
VIPDRLLAAILIGGALIVACREPAPGDPADTVIVDLGDETLMLDDLLRYFEANLLVEDRPALEPGDQAIVRSRLLDALIDERLLLAQAQRLRIEVSDREVEAYLGLDRETDEWAVTEPMFREGQRRLMIHKLHEVLASRQPAVSDAEVTRYLDQVAPGPPSRRLRFRSLMLDSAEQAEEVHRAIRRDRMTFDEAVLTHGKYPGQGVPLEVDWDDLWEEHQIALQDLRPGGVSRPIELNGDVYIFRLESWLDAAPDADDRRTQRARQRLERLHRARLFEDLVRDLRGRTEIRLRHGRLPFEYIPEESR